MPHARTRPSASRTGPRTGSWSGVNVTIPDHPDRTCVSASLGTRWTAARTASTLKSPSTAGAGRAGAARGLRPDNLPALEQDLLHGRIRPDPHAPPLRRDRVARGHRVRVAEARLLDEEAPRDVVHAELRERPRDAGQGQDAHVEPGAAPRRGGRRPV